MTLGHPNWQLCSRPLVASKGNFIVGLTGQIQVWLSLVQLTTTGLVKVKFSSLSFRMASFLVLAF